jgi:hypothetical protein
MAERRRTYEDRRPYAVPVSLGDLHGPDHGQIDLPMSVAWTGRRSYDLDSPDDQRVMYERVVVEAVSLEELGLLLNRAVLERVWTSLYLPPRVRALWQSRFPALTAAA